MNASNSVPGFYDTLCTDWICARCGKMLKSGQSVFMHLLKETPVRVSEPWCNDCETVPLGEETVTILRHQLERAEHMAEICAGKYIDWHLNYKRRATALRERLRCL
jgi:hypothetical protein